MLQPLLNGLTAYLHCEALALQKLSADLNEVLEIVIKIVNFIKTRLMKDQLFQHLSNELKAKYNNLSFHHNSKWLSKGKVYFCVYKLRNEIIIFLKEENHSLATIFIAEVFLTKLVYLCDVFQKLNQLNILLQGKVTHILQLHDTLTPFKQKL